MNVDMVEYLISAGCNVNSNWTPLNLAISRPTNPQLESIVRVLYLAGGIPSRVRTGAGGSVHLVHPP